MFHWEKNWFCIAFGLICCDELTNPDYCSVHSLGLNPLLNFQKRGGLGRISVLRECQQIIFVTLSSILATMRERQRERDRERQRVREREWGRETEAQRHRHRQRVRGCSVPMKNNLKSEIFNDKKSYFFVITNNLNWEIWTKNLLLSKYGVWLGSIKKTFITLNILWLLKGWRGSTESVKKRKFVANLVGF